MSTPSGRDEPVAAALRVSGRLDARWAAWFDGLTLSHDPDGTTALTGTVSDQAQLHALLVRIRDLGMTLVSLTTYSVADSLAPDFAPPPDGLSALSPACDHGWMRITALPAGLATAAVDLWRSCGLTRPWNDPAADLTRALAGPASTVLAAIEDEHLLGTVMVGHDGHRGWVYYLAVHAARRGTGLGRTLMTAAESWLEQQGMSKVQLMVRSDNHAVVGFYEELGYVDQGVLVLGRFLDPELQALREREQHDADPHGGGGVVDARTAHHRGVGAGRLTPPGAG